ncbi:MAG: 30S ribosomal protein S6 [Nitrospinae bacterium]|nr:30S ribosomal protein S6 [Nitrospinota bacterium]
MVTKDYETLFIIKPDLSDEDVEKETGLALKIIEGDSGSIIEKSLWGKKRLAYSIAKQRYGHYVLLRFSAPSVTPEKLTRHFRFNENILKGMVVMYDAAAGRGLEEQRRRAPRSEGEGDAPVPSAFNGEEG